MPKGKSGIKRESKVENGKQNVSDKPKEPSRTFEVSRTVINASSPDSIEKLRIMAQRGEIPQSIELGSREQREQIYEEFNRLYPDPPGILNDYRVEKLGSKSVHVTFNYNMAEAESPPMLTFPSRHSSEGAQAGVIKHAIYERRPAVENALLVRMGGYATSELAMKYGKRVLSGDEKAKVDREMIRHVERLLGSPITKAGQEYNQAAWIKRGGGWVRAGALDAADYGITSMRNGNPS